MVFAADRERARHALSFHAKPLGLGRPPALSQAGGRKHPLQHFAGPSKQNSSLVNAAMQRLRMGHITLQLTSSTLPRTVGWHSFVVLHTHAFLASSNQSSSSIPQTRHCSRLHPFSRRTALFFLFFLHVSRVRPARERDRGLFGFRP